jgi:hypothetical protein
VEKPEFRQQEEVWLQIIPCHKGHQCTALVTGYQ